MDMKSLLMKIAASQSTTLTLTVLLIFCVYRSSAQRTGAALSHIIAISSSQSSSVLDVRDYGAHCDGNTDDSAAFTKTFYAAGEAVMGGTERASVHIPAGNCVIRDDVQLLSEKGPPIMGLVVSGEGRAATTVTYLPPASKEARHFLFSNRNRWLFVDFQDLSFVGDTKDSQGEGYTKTGWMLSDSTGQAQNYSFRNVSWTNFDIGLQLTGNNNNSEFNFFRTAMHGFVNHFIYVDASVGAGGDQFVNYSFFDTDFEVVDGSLIDMAYGGSINIWGGSFIHTGEVTPHFAFFSLGKGVNPGTHSYGAERLYVNGLRVEHRVRGSMLINSEWGGGVIEFHNVDDSTSAFLKNSDTWTTARFNAGNTGGPTVVFDSCVLMGRHEYVGSDDQYSNSQDVTYRDSSFVGHVSPADFIIRRYATNPGGFPVIHFQQGRFSDSFGPAKPIPSYNSDYGWDVSAQGFTTERVLSLRAVSGSLTGDALITFGKVPINALITRVVFIFPSGAVSDANPTRYILETDEEKPTVLAVFNAAGVSGTMDGSIHSSVDVFFKGTSDRARTVKLVSSAKGPHQDAGVVLIFFIG